ncbi:MAG: hypothetical protein BJ554DRAFT_8319, partial [Olpidium bornovanus]
MVSVRHGHVFHFVVRQDLARLGHERHARPPPLPSLIDKRLPSSQEACRFDLESKVYCHSISPAGGHGLVAGKRGPPGANHPSARRLGIDQSFFLFVSFARPAPLRSRRGGPADTPVRRALGGVRAHPVWPPREGSGGAVVADRRVPARFRRVGFCGGRPDGAFLGRAKSGGLHDVVRPAQFRRRPAGLHQPGAQRLRQRPHVHGDGAPPVVERDRRPDPAVERVDGAQRPRELRGAPAQPLGARRVRGRDPARRRLASAAFPPERQPLHPRLLDPRGRPAQEAQGPVQQGHLRGVEAGERGSVSPSFRFRPPRLWH